MWLFDEYNIIRSDLISDEREKINVHLNIRSKTCIVTQVNYFLRLFSFLYVHLLTLRQIVQLKK